jgi:ParB/RepB/Spo0J family partition protein
MDKSGSRVAVRKLDKSGSRVAVKKLAQVRELPLERVDTPRRPARRFLGDVAALAESMQDFGLQQPISVRVNGDRFMLTSGLRRLAAARLLGWTSIPAFVRNVNADEAYVLDLIENLQRQDLSAEEEADALGELIRTRGWTLQQVADTIKRSLGYVSKRVRLFEDQLLRDAVTNRGMPVSTAEELLGAPPEHRAQLIERALAERWDQVGARDALSVQVQPGYVEAAQVAGPSRAALAPPDDATFVDSRSETIRGAVARARDRPRGFTRAIREFHRAINDIRAEDLTSSDRAALRALFRDLVFLARAPSIPGVRVFPPLPPLAGSTRSTSGKLRQKQW